MLKFYYRCYNGEVCCLVKMCAGRCILVQDYCDKTYKPNWPKFFRRISPNLKCYAIWHSGTATQSISIAAQQSYQPA